MKYRKEHEKGVETKSGVRRRHEPKTNIRTEPHKTRRTFTYAMRDTSGVPVDVTRVSKSGSGNTAAEWVASGEATQRATARWVATESVPNSGGPG